MLYKSKYYHGAAVLSILEDNRCKSINKLGHLGYLVNTEIFVFLKYTTKSRSPWGFTFDQEDVDRCSRLSSEYKKVILGFVCAGDGVCGIDWLEAKQLLGNKSGRIAISRKHDHSYSIWGSAGELKRKISVTQWPIIVFEHSDPLGVQ